MALVLSGDSPSISGTYQGGVITSGTAVASTSGTSIDFTSIPSWVKRITVIFNGTSTNGSSLIQVQIGSGSVTTSGYVGSITTLVNASPLSISNLTTGFGIGGSSSGDARTGHMVITNISGNIWVDSVNGTTAAGTCTNGGGTVTLGGTLDRVRITTVNGTDTFDAGSINILYE